MEIQWLETFRAVATGGSISAAARTLGYTQSAVSRQIGALENDLGTPLFDRLPRGVALTDAGRTLLPHAEAVVGRIATARTDLDDREQLRQGRLRVGAFPTAIARLVPRALARFRARHPAIGTGLVEGFTPELLRRLDSGEAEIAIVSAPDRATFDETRHHLRHLLDESMLLAVPRTHRLARRRTVRLDEVRDEPFIVGSAMNDHELLRARLPAGFRPRVDIVAAGWTAKWGCVAAGLGVALVPSLAVRGTPPDITLLELHADDTAIRQVYAATPAGRSAPPPVRAFLEDLAAAAALTSR